MCRVRSLTLLSLPSGGNALLVSLVCRSVLHHFHFKGAVHSVSFSPDGRYASAGGWEPWSCITHVLGSDGPPSKPQAAPEP